MLLYYSGPKKLTIQSYNSYSIIFSHFLSSQTGRTWTKRLIIILSKPRISEFTKTCDPVLEFPRGTGRGFGVGILITAVDHAGLGIRTSERWELWGPVRNRHSVCVCVGKKLWGFQVSSRLERRRESGGGIVVCGRTPENRCFLPV
jgi:hypothetical protein